MSNLPRGLQDQLRHHKLIPFVGAGVAMAVRHKTTGEHLFPSWKELLERASQRLIQEHSPHANIVRELVGLGSDEYLEAARRARQGLSGGIWFEFLREQLRVPRDDVADDSLDLARAIWELGSSLIITANTDRVLRWACPNTDEVAIWDIQAPADQLEALRFGGPTIPTVWHLHGTIDNASDMILTPDGYRRLYPEGESGETSYKAALTTLHQFMTSHTLLFIGFSLNDTHIGTQLSGLHEVFQGATGPHYALVSESQAVNTRFWIQERNLPVQVVTFEDFGEPLLNLVRSMGEIAAEHQEARNDINPTPADTGSIGTRPNYAPSNYVFYVPYRQKGNQVVGREHALEEVHRQLTSGHRRTAIGQAMAFQGLGGLGKTQLAVEYAYRFKDEYPSGVIWINADQDIETQLTELGDRAGWVAPDSEHRYKLDVARHRLKTYSDCLIIFDNLEDFSVIEGYLPEPEADPHILVTSRTDQPEFTPFRLELLDEDLSLELLTQEAGRIPEGNLEEEAASQIVEALGGLPLALELAGGYLRHLQSVSWQRYHELLDRNLKSAMPGRFLSGSFTKHEADLYSTLKLNEELFADEPQLKDIVDLLTWSGPASMGLSLMGHLLGVEDETKLTNALALGVELRLLQMTPGEERYAIHRLVQEVRREDIPLDESRNWVSTECRRVGEWFQERRENFADMSLFASEIDHLRTWQEHSVNYAVQYACRLTWLQGYPPYHQGRFREAKEWVDKALVLYQQLGLHDSELEAHLLNDLGVTSGRLGEHRSELEYKEKALSIRERLHSLNHPDTASSLDNLGTAYIALGERRLGLDYQEQALAIRRKLLGEKHFALVMSLNNIAMNFHELGHQQRALECMKEALEICLEVLGESHPFTATSLANLGIVYVQLGDQARALDCQERALKIRSELFGQNHTDTASSLNNLGTLYARRGEYNRALEYQQEALGICRELFGDMYPHTATALHNVAVCYRELGQPKRGLEYAEKAVEIRREILGSQHPDTISCVLDLTIAYTELENATNAIKLLEELLGQIPRQHSAYSRLMQAKRDALSRLSGGGFRQQPRRSESPRKKKRRR